MRRLLLLALIATPVLAADDAVQMQLQVCRLQTAAAHAWAQEQLAALAVQLQQAQARIKELEDAAKKEPKK